MAEGKFVAYYRVSTVRQGASGLGLEAQQESVKRFLNGGSWQLVSEFQEVETGKGSDALSKRPQLKAALDACRRHGATLVIAKLDRLSRSVSFVAGLIDARVKFVAADMPEANELTVHVMAAFAEHEAKRISQRTKEALAVARSRGVRLGKAGPANLRPNVERRQEAAAAFARKLRPLFDGMAARGLSQRQMVKELNGVGIPAPRGGAWGLVQVQRTIARIGE
jgi:DNA invertase Pin-like site-specific DNA recombinase